MAKAMKSKPAATINEYIAGFPKDIQKMLELLRATIRKSAPKAEETIKYAIPTFTLNGNLVSFAAWKSHIAFYPAPVGVEGFKKELAPYAGAKSTAKFPLGKPLPLALISKMVKYRMKQMSEKEKVRNKK